MPILLRSGLSSEDMKKNKHIYELQKIVTKKTKKIDTIINISNYIILNKTFFLNSDLNQIILSTYIKLSDYLLYNKSSDEILHIFNTLKNYLKELGIL